MNTTRQAAERIGVNVQTIRRWSDEYRAHMGAESRNADQRMFTDDDLLLLWSVRRWRQIGLSMGEISERIGKGERTSDALPTVATDEPPKAIMVSEAVHTAALAEVRRLDAERERLLIERDSAVGKTEALNAKIATLEREIGILQGTLKERPGTRVWLAVLAAAVILAVIATALLLLAGR